MRARNYAVLATTWCLVFLAILSVRIALAPEWPAVFLALALIIILGISSAWALFFTALVAGGKSFPELVAALMRRIGKIPDPEFVAAVKALSTAHENDAVLDNRIGDIEKKVAGLRMAKGFDLPGAGSFQED